MTSSLLDPSNMGRAAPPYTKQQTWERRVPWVIVECLWERRTCRWGGFRYPPYLCGPLFCGCELVWNDEGVAHQMAFADPGILPKSSASWTATPLHAEASESRNKPDGVWEDADPGREGIPPHILAKASCQKGILRARIEAAGGLRLSAVRPSVGQRPWPCFAPLVRRMVMLLCFCLKI